MSEMIEFGKYRGQPVEVLATDPKYTEWLATQPWLKDRYPVIYNVIINNFSDPEETPEHNRLQAKFMDEEFLDMVGRKLFAGIKSKTMTEEACERKHSCKDGVMKCFPVDQVEYLGTERLAFEEKGIDVTFFLKYSISYEQELTKYNDEVVKDRYTGIHGLWITAELKPTIGDDYPAILREMTHKGCNLLIYENFQSEAIDENLLKKFFRTRKIKILSTKNLQTKNLIDEI